MRISLLVGFVCALLQAGCGGDGKVDVYPVTGEVTFRGKPAEGASVVLFASDSNLQRVGVPTPKGTVGSDGSFTLNSYGTGDGAPAGEYGVAISWMETITPSDDPEQMVERDRLQGRYADPSRSNLRATVTAGENQLPPFVLE